jgi:hypothetical protein
MELTTLRDWLYALAKARAERLFPMQRTSLKR